MPKNYGQIRELEKDIEVDIGLEEGDHVGELVVVGKSKETS